jgi:hypothetical protein
MSTGGYLKPILSLGWTAFHRLNALNHGAVRVYRMSSGDYLALILDAVPSNERDQAGVVTADESQMSTTRTLAVSPAGINARGWRRPGA